MEGPHELNVGLTGVNGTRNGISRQLVPRRAQSLKGTLERGECVWRGDMASALLGLELERTRRGKELSGVSVNGM